MTDKRTVQAFRVAKKLQKAIRKKASPDYFDRNVRRFANALAGKNPFQPFESNAQH